MLCFEPLFRSWSSAELMSLPPWLHGNRPTSDLFSWTATSLTKLPIQRLLEEGGLALLLLLGPVYSWHIAYFPSCCFPRELLSISCSCCLWGHPLFSQQSPHRCFLKHFLVSPPGPWREPVPMANILPSFPFPQWDPSPFPMRTILLKKSRHRWSHSNAWQKSLFKIWRRKKNSCFPQGYSESQNTELWSWKRP